MLLDRDLIWWSLLVHPTTEVVSRIHISCFAVDWSSAHADRCIILSLKYGYYTYTVLIFWPLSVPSPLQLKLSDWVINITLHRHYRYVRLSAGISPCTALLPLRLSRWLFLHQAISTIAPNLLPLHLISSTVIDVAVRRHKFILVRLYLIFAH